KEPSENLEGYKYTGKKIKLNRNKVYLEKILQVEPVGNAQSITYHRGKLYVAYDIGHGYTTILIYEYPNCQLIKRINNVGAGRASDMSYREFNNTLWVSSQGGSKSAKPAAGPDNNKFKWLEIDI